MQGINTQSSPPGQAPRSGYLRKTFVQIEIGTRCNYQCFYCVGRDMPQRYMDWELFSDILQRQPAQGVERVSLQGEGEPMMHPRFWDMVDAIRSRRLIPYTITNGSLLDPARVAAAFPAIGISIDTVDPQYAQTIGRFKLHRVLRNLDALLAVLAPERIIIHTVDMGQPLDPLKRFLAERGIKQHMVQPLQPKADYARRYSHGEPSWGPCTYHCRFLAAPLMRYYDISGIELPCCFIKNTAEFTSAEHLRQQLSERIVPTACQGCGAIFPHAKVPLAQPPTAAKSQ